MSAPAQKEKLSFALSEEYQAEFCRAVIEKILATAAVNASGSSKPALETIPAARRAEFLRFVETGETSQEFLDFVASNEAARAAIDAVFKETAAAMERLGTLLKSSQPGKSLAGFTKLPPHRIGYPPAIGDEMPDGTIYAGVSPDTGKAMYATPKDAPATFTFNEAAKYAKKLKAHGHKDFRVPTLDELNVLYQNRNEGKLKGTFNETGSYPAGWYRSSSQTNYGFAWDQRFSDGCQHACSKDYGSSLRCVR